MKHDVLWSHTCLSSRFVRVIVIILPFAAHFIVFSINKLSVCRNRPSHSALESLDSDSSERDILFR